MAERAITDPDGNNPRTTSELEQEQERGLLKEWNNGGEDESEYLDQWRRWNSLTWGAFMTLLIVISLVGVWIVADFGEYNLGMAGNGHDESPHTTEDNHSGSQANEQQHISSTIRTNDYILDPEWDFDAPLQRRVYNWTIRDHEHNPDGIFRLMTLANSEFPGPLIEVNEGDTIVVHVNNQAVNATAIHWHGIYQNNTPHMDGTVGVTQCPIPPGGEFTYEFTVSGQSGTYWWHSHHSVQSSDGLHGPLVVHSRNEREIQPKHYDTDRVLLISDHYHDSSSALLWQYLLPDVENAEPVPQGGLINGRNIRNCDDFLHRRCDNTSTHVSKPRLELGTGQSHRLRLINVGAFAEFQFQIDEHELAVTEVDGTDVQPINYHRLNINPAQRYSVIVESNVRHAESFWLRARMITKCFTDPPSTLDPDVLGIVRYYETHEKRHEGHGDDGESIPTSVDWEEQLEQECRDLNTIELRPAQAMAAPANADALFYVRSNFEIGAYRLSRGKFNSSTWHPDIRSPSLYRSINGVRSGNESFKASTERGSAFVNSNAFDEAKELVIQTIGIQTIDLLISNFDDGNHPIHLHGYKYFVLAQGHGYPPMTSVGGGITVTNLAPLYNSLDLSNPLRRDTASVEAFGWILIRVIADNPGAWALHCHVSWHTEAGLLMQLLTRADELGDVEVPVSHDKLCSAEGIEEGGTPADELFYDLPDEGVR